MTRKTPSPASEPADRADVVLTVVCPDAHALASVTQDDKGGYVVNIRHFAVGDSAPDSARGYLIEQGAGGRFRLLSELDGLSTHQIACRLCGRDDFDLAPRQLLDAIRAGTTRVVLRPYTL